MERRRGRVVDVGPGPKLGTPGNVAELTLADCAPYLAGERPVGKDVAKVVANLINKMAKLEPAYAVPLYYCINKVLSATSTYVQLWPSECVPLRAEYKEDDGVLRIELACAGIERGVVEWRFNYVEAGPSEQAKATYLSLEPNDTMVLR